MYTLLTYEYDEMQDLLKIEGLKDSLIRDVYLRTEKAHLLERAYDKIKENLIKQLIKARQASIVIIDENQSRFSTAILQFGKSMNFLPSIYPLMVECCKIESDDKDKTQVIIDFLYSENLKYIGINFGLPISTRENCNVLGIEDMDLLADDYDKFCKANDIKPKTYNGLDYIEFYKNACFDMVQAIQEMETSLFSNTQEKAKQSLMKVCEYCLKEVTFDNDYQYALNCVLFDGILERPKENNYNFIFKKDKLEYA